MYSNPRKMLLGSSLMLAVGGTMMVTSAIMLSFSSSSTTQAADTGAQQLATTCHKTRISPAYALSPYLRATDLEVSVDNGKATLAGTARDGVYKDLTTQIVLGLEGIMDFDNRPVVNPDYTP